jgi:uncharacterized protein (DUF1330 family)
MQRSIAAAFIAAFVLSAPARALPPPEAPAYLVVVGKATDRARMAQYASALPSAYAEAGGFYLGIGGPGRGVTWIEGPWRDRSLVVARFPNAQAIDRFWWGPIYREAIKLRDRAGVFDVVAAPGIAVSAPQGADAAYLVIMSPEGKAADAVSAAFAKGVAESGGALLNDGAFTPLEGDTVFSRVHIAAWPNKAARQAYLDGRAGKAAARLRARAGLFAVATIDGVAPAAPPPAARQ